MYWLLFCWCIRIITLTKAGASSMKTTVPIHLSYLPLKIRPNNLQKLPCMNPLWACHAAFTGSEATQGAHPFAHCWVVFFFFNFWFSPRCSLWKPFSCDSVRTRSVIITICVKKSHVWFYMINLCMDKAACSQYDKDFPSITKHWESSVQHCRACTHNQGGSKGGQ